MLNNRTIITILILAMNLIIKAETQLLKIKNPESNQILLEFNKKPEYKIFKTEAEIQIEFKNTAISRQIKQNYSYNKQIISAAKVIYSETYHNLLLICKTVIPATTESTEINTANFKLNLDFLEKSQKTVQKPGKENFAKIKLYTQIFLIIV